jgi:hypothetical protein
MWSCPPKWFALHNFKAEQLHIYFQVFKGIPTNQGLSDCDARVVYSSSGPGSV